MWAACPRDFSLLPREASHLLGYGSQIAKDLEGEVMDGHERSPSDPTPLASQSFNPSAHVFISQTRTDICLCS